MHIIRLLVKFISIVAALWTIGVSVYIIFAPSQSRTLEYVTLPDGTLHQQEVHISSNLLQREGWLGVIAFILLSLSLPIAVSIAGVRAAWRYRQGLLWSMAGAMLLFSFLGGFSIGMAYMAAACGLLVAALLNSVQLRFSKSSA